MRHPTLGTVVLKAKSSILHTASSWLVYEKHLEVYVRVNQVMMINGELTNVLTLANMLVCDSSKRGKGLLTSFLGFCGTQTDLPIVVENVVNPRLYGLLLRNGFSVIETSYPCLSPSYFRPHTLE